MCLKFSRFLTSQILSLFAEELLRFALPAIFFLETGNAFGSSVLYCCVLGPRVFLGSFLAYLSDHFSPHLIFKRVILGQAILTGLFPIMTLIFSTSNLWVWAACAVTLSVLNSVQYGAIQSILPLFWKGKELLRANGLLGSMEAAVLFLAPLGAGFLLDISGLGLLCWIGMTVCLMAYVFQRGILPDLSKKNESFLPKGKILMEGWTFISANKPLLLNLVLTAPVNMLLAICLALLTPMVLQSSEGKTYILGFIFSMGAIGQLLGGICCRYLGLHVSIKWILYSGFMIGGLLGLVPMGFFQSTAVWAGGFFFCGFGMALINTSNQTIWQLACPDHIRSRVTSARRSINTLLGAPGFLIALPLVSLLAPVANTFTTCNPYTFIFALCGVLLLMLGILGGIVKTFDPKKISLEFEKCSQKKD